jgi:hypothetical protein
MPGDYESPQVQYIDAQSTRDAGQNQMRELSHRATMVGLDLSQAANAADQATLDGMTHECQPLFASRPCCNLSPLLCVGFL